MSFFFVRGAKSKENPKEEPKAPQAVRAWGAGEAGPARTAVTDLPPGTGRLLLHHLTPFRRVHPTPESEPTVPG